MLGAARADALGGRLPADARGGDGGAAGAHHVDEDRLDHLHPGHLRSGRRPHRPLPGDDLRPPRRDARALAPDPRSWASTRRSTRSTRRAASSTPSSSAPSTTMSRAGCRASCSATRSCATSSRFWAWTSCPTTTSWWWRGRARSSASSPSRSSSPRCSPGSAGKYVPLKDTIAGFKAIADGEMDEYPEQAFYMVGDIEEVREKAKSV